MIRVLRYSSLLNYGVGLVVACVALLLLWPGLAQTCSPSATARTRL
jgi:hypothetical protein